MIHLSSMRWYNVMLCIFYARTGFYVHKEMSHIDIDLSVRAIINEKSLISQRVISTDFRLAYLTLYRIFYSWLACIFLHNICITRYFWHAPYIHISLIIFQSILCQLLSQPFMLTVILQNHSPLKSYLNTLRLNRRFALYFSRKPSIAFVSPHFAPIILYLIRKYTLRFLNLI